MYRALFALLALVVTFTLAVPTPYHASDKFTASKRIGSFKAAANGRHSRHTFKQRNARSEIERVYRKYNWSISFVTPDGQTFSLGDTAGGSSSNPSAGASSAASSSGSGFGSLFGSPDSSSSSGASSGSSGSSDSGFGGLFGSDGAGSAAPTSSASATQSSGASNGGLGALFPGYSASASAPSSSSTGSASSSNASSGSNENGEVSATPEENESEYLSPVSIGGQKLNLDFDTGSADLWVFSTDLSSSEIGQHSTYDPSQSSSSETLDGASWQIRYGDGSGASGTVVLDTVDVGGATATKQAIELATQVSRSFVADENNDGLLGLAFSKINTVQPTPQKTFFENIMDDLDQPVFTADLEDDAAGTYEFGTVDSAKYEGEIHFTEVDTTRGFWEFESSTYTINGKEYTNNGASAAIADTGTSLLLVDEAVAEAFYDQIEGAQLSTTAGGYVYPCNADVPEFGVQIGNSGFVATIPGEDIAFAEVGTATCFGGVQGNSGQGLQIFGDVLLKQYFAVFNGGNKTFGVAKKSAGNQQASS